MKIKKYITPAVLARFWKHTTAGTGCWLWTGWTDRDGYGNVNIRLDGRNYGCKAHRFSWIIHNDQEWPAGLIGRHLCNNPSCVNPEHIKPGTQQENMDDAVAIGSIKNAARIAKGVPLMTPHGIFDTITEAREALNIPRPTMDKWLKNGKPGYYRLK